eukprot:CAMPEP_0174752792 /NCGR_PEP_ID=MMETSP1094-20130205/102783_1 /TAXON_ID=156173 /ORGANISM="Chrysochromulina brevifilum, Strain UTEX LB 985" /LENGTH=85 /DNA_ID=CAMNT_0015958471 /DNA_START=294 /DNA_END=548 /DNA_ORIENTATION=+
MAPVPCTLYPASCTLGRGTWIVAVVPSARLTVPWPLSPALVALPPASCITSTMCSFHASLTACHHGASAPSPSSSRSAHVMPWLC